MSHAIVYSTRATRQLEHLYGYIARNAGEPRAAAFIGALTDFCAGFSTFPERGTRRSDIRTNMRTIGFRRHVTVVFEVMDDKVVILGIFYGGQDFENDPDFVA